MAMKSAYGTSGKIFDQVSKLHDPNMYGELREITPGEIVVVQGEHDQIQDLMDTLKVPYKLVGTTGEIPYDRKLRVVIANCRTYHGSEPRIKSFVEGGGRLVTSDWALSLASHTFPKRLHHQVDTSDDVVIVQCANDNARKMIGLHYSQCKPQWWLEGSSHIYSIDKHVVPLIVSEEMKEKYGQPYVGVAFKHGTGEVAHFISHFKLQRTKQKGNAKGDLEKFLEEMGAAREKDMDGTVNYAELEAAYSTLNMLAYLCIKTPLLEDDEPIGKSASKLYGATNSKKAKSLL